MVREKYDILVWKTWKSQGISRSRFSGHPLVYSRILLHGGRGQEKPGNVGDKKFDQGKINCEQICNLKKSYIE